MRRGIQSIVAVAVLAWPAQLAIAQELASTTSPVLVREYKPEYTKEARDAKVQGLVELKAVVLADGTVGDVTVTKSLDDNKYGLDDAAVKTMKRWLFKPGTKDGKAVPVEVSVEMSFTLK
jgi:protein TonB